MEASSHPGQWRAAMPRCGRASGHFAENAKERKTPCTETASPTMRSVARGEIRGAAQVSVAPFADGRGKGALRCLERD